MKDDFLHKKLKERSEALALRSLRIGGSASDYFSNDYLGIVKNQLIEKAIGDNRFSHGSTGSRLLSGNYELIEKTEKRIADFHEGEAALIFNSGYDANFGLMACIANRGDLVLFDKLCHASIRDGIRQSFAMSSSFVHNDMEDLEKKLKERVNTGNGNCFVVTESVFSMDGDIAPLEQMVLLCERFNAHLIIDEAHATGVIGTKGEGLVQSLGIHKRCFARMHTFGKALGCHGAVILGSALLRTYLINFCRPIIYSTAISPVAVAAIDASYTIFPGMQQERLNLKKLIALFDNTLFRRTFTPIQYLIIPGNEQVKKAAAELITEGLDVRPILYPTVPLGQERLRITLHSFNTMSDTEKMISVLSDFVR